MSLRTFWLMCTRTLVSNTPKPRWVVGTLKVLRESPAESASSLTQDRTVWAPRCDLFDMAASVRSFRDVVSFESTLVEGNAPAVCGILLLIGNYPHGAALKLANVVVRRKELTPRTDREARCQHYRQTSRHDDKWSPHITLPFHDHSLAIRPQEMKGAGSPFSDWTLVLSFLVLRAHP